MSKDTEYEVTNYLSFPATIDDPSKVVDGYVISQIVATISSLEPILNGLDLRAEIKELCPDVGEQAYRVPIYSTSDQIVIDDVIDNLQKQLDTLRQALVNPEQIVQDGHYRHNSPTNTKKAKRQLQLAEAVAKALRQRKCQFQLLTSSLELTDRYELEPRKSTEYADAKNRLNPPALDATTILACAGAVPLGERYYGTLESGLVQSESATVARCLASGNSHHFVARKRNHTIQVYELIRLATDGELPWESGDLLNQENAA